MRLIPGKTKVGMELFKGLTLTDLIVYIVGAVLAVCFLLSSLPGHVYIAIGTGILTAMLGAHLDKEPLYQYLFHVLRYFTCHHRFERVMKDKMLLDNQQENATEIAFENAFAEEEPKEEKKGKKEKKPKAPKETPEQKAERIAKEKEKAEEKKKKEQERKQEDKLLKDKKVPQEEKDKILEKRRIASQEAARKMAIYKDENAERAKMKDIMAFTDIHDDLIDYDGKYYGAVIEIPPVEFRFFSSYRRDNAIENGVGRILRAIRSDKGVNIIKIERPVNYEQYLENEYKKMETLRTAFENGFISEEELKARIEVLYDRINDLRNLCYGEKVVAPFYYMAFFDADRQQLANQVRNAMENLRGGEMKPKKLNTKELAVFLKYTNQIDFDEHEIENLKPEQYAQWAMPEVVDMSPRTVQINHILTHNFCVTDYPNIVGDAWMAGVMSIPSTKVVIKCSPMDRTKAIRSIDHSLQELRGQWRATGVDSKRMELQTHIETLGRLLNMLQGENETLVECNIYVTAYDIDSTRADYTLVQPPESSRTHISEMKKTVKRVYQEAGIRLNHMEFDQVKAFIGSQVSGYDPLRGSGRGIPSNSLGAAFPWVFAYVSDKDGIKLGSSDGVPVFIDFFRRDSERVNSNMVIVGKSGSGKSYATKSLLTNLAADDSKIFILDPENEYSELAQNLHGKFINVGNAQYGRLNPFHIITALDDDESEGEDGERKAGSSYATHLQFLEEFFRQILPECEKDAMEYLNSMIDRLYTNKGITEETDLSKLKPSDYPIFDDLYDTILEEFQSTDNEYIRTMLRTLMNYVSKFSTGGRNAAIWNGPSSITTEENFTVFNFQSLLANRNGTVANAQMLLVLKYIDNEIIKNRDYNTKYHTKRKIVVVIDEAHVFIDTKFPVALDFMFQLAKRIRKYNGMQIVITQNIKDFVGSEEIARKSTAIINACQYSFIFSLAPNDMDDLCKLYEKAGGINESEQEQIVQAQRGQAFTVMSPTSRSSFKVEVPDGVRDLFENRDHISGYFNGTDGAKNWEDFMGDSREKRKANVPDVAEEVVDESANTRKKVLFEEISEEEYQSALKSAAVETPRKRNLSISEIEDDFPEIPEIPDNPEEFLRRKESAAQNASVQPAAAAAAASPVIPPIVVQAPSASPDVEKVVSELSRVVDNLSRFSYEALLDRLRESGTSAPAASAAPAMPSEEAVAAFAPAEEIAGEEEPGMDALFGSLRTDESADEGVSLGSIFNDDALAEAARLDAEEGSGEEDDENGGLMDLLFNAINSSGEASVIDMMETYGDTVIGISIEELAAHIVQHANE